MKTLATIFIARGLTRDVVLKICGITRHQYYHQPIGLQGGARPSENTIWFNSGQLLKVSNTSVIEEIRNAYRHPWVDYGYQKMTWFLKLQGFMINQKKVYRLMKENYLLKAKNRRKPRVFARYRVITPECPLQVLEMDIKFIWVAKHQRHVYLLTILDVFTRTALSWHLGYSITRHEVKSLWEHVILHYLQPANLLEKGIHIEIRNDNGSQFAAQLIQDFFRENYLNQVFTHPYTPQETGHIESFHSILDRAILGKTFWTIEDAKISLSSFYNFYNNHRIHSSTANLPPVWFWELFEKNQIIMEKRKYGVKFRLKIPHYQLICLKK